MTNYVVSSNTKTPQYRVDSKSYWYKYNDTSVHGYVIIITITVEIPK